VLELVEDESIKNEIVIKLFLEEIKTYGVKIAIDDFGAGLSNFSRVLEYKPDFIKLDGSLIKNINNDPIAQSMIETIVTFAKKQNIQTIAEYVSSEEIYNTVCELGVDYSQGFYFGKPAPLQS
jgi:EAL domain-containing protein (putative c-di-GMP-specific phosphodiesterase class I)